MIKENLNVSLKEDLRSAGVAVITERLSSTGKYHELIFADSLAARKAFLRTVKETMSATNTTEEYDLFKKKTFHCKRHMVRVGDDLKEYFNTRTVLLPFAEQF